MANTGLMRTNVNGHAIAYRCAGQGPPLVLLHGFTLDSRIWRRQLEDLSDQFMVVAWDAPGAGASSDPPNPFTMADWADCLAGFLGVMGIERAHILGMSWGGVLAQEFYRLHFLRSRMARRASSAGRAKRTMQHDRQRVE